MAITDETAMGVFEGIVWRTISAHIRIRTTFGGRKLQLWNFLKQCATMEVSTSKITGEAGLTWYIQLSANQENDWCTTIARLQSRNPLYLGFIMNWSGAWPKITSAVIRCQLIIPQCGSSLCQSRKGFFLEFRKSSLERLTMAIY